MPQYWILLAALLAGLAWFVRNDGAEYAAFKALTDTRDRQRAFRRWVARSLLGFGAGALLVLVLLGRLDALWRLPPEFEPLVRAVRSGLGQDGGGAGIVAALSAALIAGGLLGTLLAIRRGKGRRSAPVGIGDIEPLLPRNREERRWTALLAANAGPAEELFFRLLLPLVIALATGEALLAFVAAAAIFGAVHFYQGPAGAVGTAVAGLVFTALYLGSGSLLVPIVMHSLMNLNALWLRPWLGRRESGG